MEALIHPTSLLGSSCGWLTGEGKKSLWSKEENKKFEKALAIFDDKTPDRWNRVAEMLPGKSVWDVIKQYKELEKDVIDIEAGFIQIPAFGFGFGSDDSLGLRKKSSSMASRPLDQERRKGVPWTEEEHRRFLLGLEKHGKGDWRSISRNFVISKTPTQVASHAQKYFLRQHSVAKDKKRPSIHDITTANLMGVLPKEAKITPQNSPLDYYRSPVADLSFDGVKFPGHDLYSCGRHGASYVA